VWRTYEKAAPRLPAAGTPAPPDALEGEARVLRRKTHRTIARVTDDLGPRMHLNTAVAAIMELINAAVPLAEAPETSPGVQWALREAFETLALLLAPFAPHFAEELWESLGRQGFVAAAAWPQADPAVMSAEEATVVVQVNGKLRGRVLLAKGASEHEALSAARADHNVGAHLSGKEVRRVVYVADKLLNLVVS
jgi:leucyl-tRNA synthetase